MEEIKPPVATATVRSKAVVSVVFNSLSVTSSFGGSWCCVLVLLQGSFMPFLI